MQVLEGKTLRRNSSPLVRRRVPAPQLPAPAGTPRVLRTLRALENLSPRGPSLPAPPDLSATVCTLMTLIAVLCLHLLPGRRDWSARLVTVCVAPSLCAAVFFCLCVCECVCVGVSVCVRALAPSCVGPPLRIPGGRRAGDWASWSVSDCTASRYRLVT